MLTTVVAVVVVAMAIATLLALPAGAHTAMLRASPDRDATVGGSIDLIELEFLDPITDAVVTVTYNGVPVPGRTTVPDGQVITYALDQPLAQPGRYQVSYEMISFDSDFTTGGFFFTFDPAAPPPVRLEPSGSGGFPTTTIALAGAGLVIVLGLLSLFVQRIDGRRRGRILEVSDGHRMGE